MIITYRFVKKKYKERQLRRNPNAAGTTASRPAVTVHETVQSELSHGAIGAPQAKTPSMSWTWRLMIMGALAIPIFLETLDYTVVATAQAHIASQFNRLDLQSYIGTIYLLTSTVFLPPFASISDIFGRHWTMQLALLLFMVGSAISTGSENMATMLAGRGVAGIGAAGLLAVVRIILTDSSSLDNVNWQQSILFFLYTIGYCLGPFIGGELLTISFRWIFAINLPFAAVAMVLGFLFLRSTTKGPQADSRLPEMKPRSGLLGFFDRLLRVDWIGAALFMAGGILVLLALNWGSTEKWDSAKVVACFVVGGVSLILFIAWEYVLEREDESHSQKSSRLLQTDPMIPLAIFRDMNICIVQFGTFVNGMIILVMFYFVAIFFVIVSGLSPTKSGVQLIYFAPGMGGGGLIAIQLIRYTRQPKYAILAGSCIVTVALGLISMAMNANNQNQVNGFLAMAGVGTGLSIGPLAVQARFSQPASRNAVVSGLTLFFRSFGGTVGLAQCGAVLNAKVNHYITNLIRSGAISGEDALAIASTSSSSGLSSLDNINALPGPVQDIVREAFRQGTRYAFISLVPWAGLSFVLALFLTNINVSDRTEQELSAEKPMAQQGSGLDEIKTDDINGTPKPNASVTNQVAEVPYRERKV